MVDLCTGPHLPSTGFLKAQAVSNLSRAFWRADAKKDPLQVRHPNGAKARVSAVGLAALLVTSHAMAQLAEGTPRLQRVPLPQVKAACDCSTVCDMWRHRLPWCPAMQGRLHLPAQAVSTKAIELVYSQKCVA